MFIPQGSQSETIATLCQGEEGSGSLGGIHLHLETVKLWNIAENFCFCTFPLDYDFPPAFLWGAEWRKRNIILITAVHCSSMLYF